MNERERQALIDGYLGRLERALGDAPEPARRELVEDVRAHIEEAWAESPTRDRAALLNILERLGEPEALAREERERLRLPLAPTGPGPLEGAAIFFTIFLWPLGLLLAWLSPRWRLRDKAVATALPILGLMFVFSTTFYARAAYSEPSVVRVATQEVAVTAEPGTVGPAVTPEAPRAEARPDAVGAEDYRATRIRALASQAEARPGVVLGLALVGLGLFGAPLAAAVYLGLTLSARRRLAVVLLALLGVLVLVVLVGLILAPIPGP